jgi:hypothetical protein
MQTRLWWDRVCVLGEGVWSQAVPFCWYILRETGFSCRDDIFTCNFGKNKFCKPSTFYAICEDNGVKIKSLFITKRFIPVKFYGS